MVVEKNVSSHFLQIYGSASFCPLYITGEEDDIKNNGKIFIDADVVNLDLELAKFIIKSVSGGYACQQCGKRCLDKSAARNHVEAKHVTTRGHLCPLCHKFVKTKNGLNNHMYRNHKRASMSPTKNKE